MSEKYSRLTILPSIGKNGLNDLFKAKVGIFGLGGLGSWSSLLMAQMGVGYLRLVDRDVVEISNLPRTPIYNQDSVDLPKAEQAAIFLKKINPKAEIEEKTTNIDETTIESLIKDLDLIIDGLDNVSTRLVINKACKKYNIPFVFAGAIGISANISTFLYNDKEPCLNCIFEMISDEDLEKCDVLGVHTALLSLVASIQVNEAIKILTGQDPVFNSKLGYIYLQTMELDHIQLKQNKNCTVCFPKEESKKENKTRIVELCGDKTFLVPNQSNLTLNLEKISATLEQKNFKLIKKSSLGMTIEFEHKEKKILISLFSNGNILIRGETESSEVTLIYQEIKMLLL